MNDVEKIDNNDVYLTLDNQPSDEFILKQNIDALIQSKNIVTGKQIGRAHV